MLRILELIFFCKKSFLRIFYFSMHQQNFRSEWKEKCKRPNLQKKEKIERVKVKVTTFLFLVFVSYDNLEINCFQNSNLKPLIFLFIIGSHHFSPFPLNTFSCTFFHFIQIKNLKYFVLLN